MARLTQEQVDLTQRLQHLEIAREKLAASSDLFESTLRLSLMLQTSMTQVRDHYAANSQSEESSEEN